jgi:hypothetical protein
LESRSFLSFNTVILSLIVAQFAENCLHAMAFATRSILTIYIVDKEWLDRTAL